MSAGIEPQPPTHVLTVTVPLRLVSNNPLIDSTVIRDSLNTVLAMVRVSGSVAGVANAELAEVDADEPS